MSDIPVIFDQEQVYLYSNNALVGGVGKINRLYEISFKIKSKNECLNDENLNNETQLWHKILGHI